METRGQHRHMRGDNGRHRRQGETPRQSGHTIQHIYICGGDNGRPGKTRNGRHGRQGRQGETRGDKGRQDLGKADIPSNTGTHVGKQWENREDETSKRRTRHPTKENKKGDNGRQGETTPREGGHTIQKMKTRRETIRDKGHTMGEEGRQDLGKADTRQEDTRPWEGGHTIQHRHTCGETMGQGEIRPREGGRTIQHKFTCGETMGDNWKHGKARPREGGRTTQHRHTCGETRGDKTSRRRTHHPTQAHM